MGSFFACAVFCMKCTAAPWRDRKVRTLLMWHGMKCSAAPWGMELEHLWHVLKKETPGWDWKGQLLLRRLKREHRIYLEDEAEKKQAEKTRQAWIAKVKKQMREKRVAGGAEKMAAAGLASTSFRLHKHC